MVQVCGEGGKSGERDRQKKFGEKKAVLKNQI